ncbi:MAG: SEC-C domain-containing protein, partial [Spirochaetaceae bacterium]|nr:SEC-C domain-containing protein [Spirochaetaceae bacterium]
IEKQKWLADYEEVKNLGGLYVIGTERHESRRIDNQLRGRSGRQGDPGRSKFYISMDDDLMRLFGGEKMKLIMSRIGMQPGEPIFHPWLNKGIEKAQTKVEERNFEIRKHLLEYDDVLNEQRNFIYEQRDQILVDTDLKKRILATAEETVNSLAETFNASGRKNEAEATAELCTQLKTSFGLTVTGEDISSHKKNLEEYLYTLLENDLKEKELLAGTENLNMFIRYQYVQFIDKKWLDHLEQLEGLREAVYLRSYGSKNPLTEYKIDGFNIFEEMLDSIRNEIAGRVFKVKVQQENPANRRGPQIKQMNAQHNAMQAFDGNAAKQSASSSAMAQKRQADNVTVIRTAPKTGRNEPCPCGSGKKYKQCCGR